MVDRGIEHDDGSVGEVREDPRIGAVLQGRYKVTKLLGTGGMGKVYQGERIGLGRPVAIKFLHSMFAREPAAVKRFEREAKAMSRLSHPNCISVIDVGVEGTPYIVMDHVSGRSLCDVLDDGLLRLRRVLEITRQILAGLAHAHSQGIVHRDIKPGNIMLTEVEGTEDHVSILDFGLAKFRDAVLMQDITASAMLVGTPGYMSPEQTDGEEAGIGSDLYAVGIILFEMLTDRKPYEADNPLSVLRMHRDAKIPSVRARAPDRKIPRALESVVNKALAKDLDDRYTSAAQFSRAIEKVARQMSEKHRRRRRGIAKASIAAGALAAVSLGVFVFATGDSTAHQTSASAPPAQAAAITPKLTVPPTPDSKVKSVTTAAPSIVAEPKRALVSVSPPVSVLPTEAPVTPEPPTRQEMAEAKPKAKPAAAKPRSLDRPLRLRDIRRMIARKQNGAAIRGLLKMRRKQPRNAYLAYLVASVCMKQQMWNAAITHYRIAIANKKAYRKNPKIIRDGVFVLSSLRSRDRANARNLLVYAIGGSALSHLDRTARYSKSPRLRRGAKSVARQIRSKYRRKKTRRARRRYRRRR